MFAINHALTGATIGLAVGRPVVAVPVALLSHFVCDAIPHFDSNKPADVWIKASAFARMVGVDALLCVALVGVLALFHPVHWQLAAICAFLATSPDLLWVNRFVKARRGKVWHPSRYAKFAGDIQWFAKPIGGVVEACWLLTGILLVSLFLR